MEANKVNIDLEQLTKLHEIENCINISCSEQLDQLKIQIEQNQQQKQDYQICIDFSENDSSIEQKLKVIELIEQLDAEQKVGLLAIKLNKTNVFDEQIIDHLIKRYCNLVEIQICDQLDEVDHGLQAKLVQLVDSKSLFEFGLLFEGSLRDSVGSLQLIKQYNQSIKKQEYLKNLWYCNGVIDQLADCQEDIQRVVNEVDSL